MWPGGQVNPLRDENLPVRRLEARRLNLQSATYGYDLARVGGLRGSVLHGAASLCVLLMSRKYRITRPHICICRWVGR